METLETMIEEVRSGRVSGLTGRVGYVYPLNGESYYIHSNLMPCLPIDCVDGYFYAERECDVHCNCNAFINNCGGDDCDCPCHND